MTQQVYISRKVHFSSAHRLYNRALSDAENAAIFGHCANPKGHGHNYILEVWLRGGVDPGTGYVFDLSKLKSLMQAEVVEHVDHKHLNEDVAFLSGINPTAENLAVCFWQRLEDHLPAGLLHAVRVYESDNNFAEYRGD